MKKIGVIVFLILNLFLLTNCGKTENKEEATVEKTKVFTEKEQEFIQLFNKDSLEKFSTNKKEIEEKLKTSTKEEADKLYHKFNESTPSLIDELNMENQKVLAKISPYTPEDLEDKLSKEEMQEVTNRFLDNYDLRIKYIGEGENGIDMKSSFYYDLFKNYVTDDYKEYLELMAKENEEGFALDGGLVITYKELGERIATWEHFKEKYSNSDLTPIVDGQCNMYRSIYILGLPNTPTMDENVNGEAKAIYEENVQEFNRFMKKYPDSPTVELIEYFLENYKDENISQVITDRLEQM